MESVNVATDPTKAQVAANCPCSDKARIVATRAMNVEVTCILSGVNDKSITRRITSRRGRVTSGQVT